MRFFKKRWKEILAVTAIIVLFIAASSLSEKYSDALLEIFGDHRIGSVFLYLGIILVSFVFAPLNALPFLPVAVVLWGEFITILVSLIGWTVGTVVTYWLSRRYGRILVTRFVSLEKIEQYEKKLPQENKFWGTAFLHMVFSGDILGYVMGLFIKMPYGRYALASFLGNIPFAIVLVYATGLPIVWQIAVGVLIVVVTGLGIWKVGEKIARQ